MPHCTIQLSEPSPNSDSIQLKLTLDIVLKTNQPTHTKVFKEGFGSKFRKLKKGPDITFRTATMFFMFFKEQNLFFCSLKNAFLGKMFFTFRKYVTFWLFRHNLAILCYYNQILTISLPENFDLGKFGQPQHMKKWSENLIILKYQNLSLFGLALQSNNRHALCAKHGTWSPNFQKPRY